MSAAETAKQLFDGMKGLKEAVQAVAPGLKGVEVAEGVKDVAQQKGTQGAAELAQALFSPSNAYVPYGAGQQSPQSHDDQREAGGMER